VSVVFVKSDIATSGGSVYTVVWGAIETVPYSVAGVWLPPGNVAVSMFAHCVKTLDAG
jgi:hypothetical protein